MESRFLLNINEICEHGQSAFFIEDKKKKTHAGWRVLRMRDCGSRTATRRLGSRVKRFVIVGSVRAGTGPGTLIRSKRKDQAKINEW